VKAIRSVWLGEPPIGIVVGETDFGHWKTYMKAITRPATQDIDEQWVLDYGVKLSLDVAKAFFPELEEELEKNKER
jgi:hypothetical protein